MLGCRCSSATRTVPGSGARTRTPTVCCASTSRRASISAPTAPTSSLQWPPRSTAGLGRRSAGRLPPKPSTNYYFHTSRPVLRRPPEPGQYTSGEFRDLLDANGMRQSLAAPGQCWDNAVAESFWSTLKEELVYQQSWPTRARARHAIFEFVEVFYNRQRLHSSLGYLSPAEYEARGSGQGEAVDAA